jgi:type IV pilus assembly protein PilM
MFRLGRTRPLVGLDLGSSFLRAVVLDRRRTGWSLVAARQLRLPGVPGDRGAAGIGPARTAARYLLDDIAVTGAVVATALSGHAVMVRRVTVPAATPSELPAIVSWEAEQYLPFDPADVRVDYHVVAHDVARGTIDILLVAARRESVAARLSLLEGTLHHPAIVEPEVCALTNAYLANYPDDLAGACLLVHVGRRVTTVCLVVDGEARFARDVSAGIQIHLDALLRELSPRGIDEDQAARGVEGGSVAGVASGDIENVLREASFELAQAVRKTVEYHGEGVAPAGPVRVLLSGGAYLTPGLADVLSRELEAPVEIFDPFRRIARADAVLDAGVPRPAYAVAVGLAMRQEDAR